MTTKERFVLDKKSLKDLEKFMKDYPTEAKSVEYMLPSLQRKIKSYRFRNISRVKNFISGLFGVTETGWDTDCDGSSVNLVFRILFWEAYMGKEFTRSCSSPPDTG